MMGLSVDHCIIYRSPRQRLAEKEAALAKESLEQVGKQLARELEGSKVKDDRIQRLEKRLLFVAKVMY